VSKEPVDLLAFLATIKGMRSRGPEGYAYSCVEDWLLQHGQAMSPASEWSSSQQRYLRWLREMVNPEIKQCFANCQRAVLYDFDSCLTYCEGYVSVIIPIYHAWLTVDGKLWDPTLELTKDPLPTEYFGSAFPAETVRSAIVTRKMHGPVLDNYEERWPILRNPWKGGA